MWLTSFHKDKIRYLFVILGNSQVYKELRFVYMMCLVKLMSSKESETRLRMHTSYTHISSSQDPGRSWLT
jgi:hypothetical protein